MFKLSLATVYFQLFWISFDEEHGPLLEYLNKHGPSPPPKDLRRLDDICPMIPKKLKM